MLVWSMVCRWSCDCGFAGRPALSTYIQVGNPGYQPNRLVGLTHWVILLCNYAVAFIFFFYLFHKLCTGDKQVMICVPPLSRSV